MWNTENVYNDDTKENDIIILKLKTPLSFNSKIDAASLPTKYWAPEETNVKKYVANDVNNNCFVSGWGALKHSKLLKYYLN